jgi:hypothetical protein
MISLYDPGWTRRSVVMMSFNGDETWRQHRNKALGASGICDQCITPAIEMSWLSRLVEYESA